MDALVYFAAELLKAQLGCTFVDPAEQVAFDEVLMHRKRWERETVYRRWAQSAGPIRRCALYRHFDDAGVLLYVGISNDPITRGKDHARGSVWHRFATETEATWYHTREDAEHAEAEAIRSERPLFNAAHNDGVSSVDRVRYLYGRGAWDLLDPRARAS